jgi:hypothetical protein
VKELIEDVQDFGTGGWTWTYNFLNSLTEYLAELLLCPAHTFYAHFMQDLLFHEGSGLP